MHTLDVVAKTDKADTNPKTYDHSMNDIKLVLRKYNELQVLPTTTKHRSANKGLLQF